MSRLKLSQLAQKIDKLPIPSAEKFDVEAAQKYNNKSKQYFQKYEQDIKRILNTNADWLSPEFAQAVYDWQQKNGFSGRWIDGKFGPATMAKLSKMDTTLQKSYDPYSPWKERHANEKPYKKVVSLVSEVDRIRKEMGATDIPLNMLMGWIQVESGGRINDLTTSAGFREAGLFQVSEDEARAIGVDQQRLLEDQDYSIRAGITLARHHAENVDRILARHPNTQKFFRRGSELYWHLVMFSFSAGPGTVESLVQHMMSSGETFSDWNDVMRFAAANPTGYKHSPIKWSYHVNRAFNIGNQIVGGTTSIARTDVLKRIKNARRKARWLVLDDFNK